MALTSGFFNGQGTGNKNIVAGKAPGPAGSGNYGNMGTTATGSNGADNAAAAVYGAPQAPNATRMNRMRQLADVVGQNLPGYPATGTGDYNIQTAFIDDSTPTSASPYVPTLNAAYSAYPGANTFGNGGLPSELNAAQINGQGTGFPGISQDTSYPSGSTINPVPKPAPSTPQGKGGNSATVKGNARAGGAFPVVNPQGPFPGLP